MEHISNSEAETRELATHYARTLLGGDVVELVGELGSGKTTFVRGVAQALGSTVRVKSPTFTVLNEYPASHGSIKRIAHLDLYRFNDPVQLEALALDEYIRPDTVVFIEWPDIFIEPAITTTRRVEFFYVDEGRRKIVW